MTGQRTGVQRRGGRRGLLVLGAWLALGCLYLLTVYVGGWGGPASDAPGSNQEVEYKSFPRTYGEFSSDQFVELFTYLAFSQQEGQKNLVVNRWDKSKIYYNFLENTDDQYKDMALAFFGRMSGIINREFSLSDNWSDPDIMFYFGKTDDLIERTNSFYPPRFARDTAMQQRMRNGQCWVVFDSGTNWLSSEWRYHRAHIFIKNTLSSDGIESCLIEEVSHAMGILNDYPNIYSVFSDGIFVPDFTELDLAVLRALYSDRLYAGMPKAEAMDVVRAWFEKDRAAKSELMIETIQ